MGASLCAFIRIDREGNKDVKALGPWAFTGKP